MAGHGSASHAVASGEEPAWAATSAGGDRPREGWGQGGNGQVPLTRVAQVQEGQAFPAGWGQSSVWDRNQQHPTHVQRPPEQPPLNRLPREPNWRVLLG